MIDVSVPTKNEMCGASKLAANEHKCLNKSDISAFQLIVEYNQQHQSTLQQDLADAWLFNTISITNRKPSNNFQQRVMLSCIHQLIVKLTSNTDSEGVLAQENILNATGAILTSEGAPIPSSTLIAGNHLYKISLHFCRNCTIFCEGVSNAIVKQHRISLVGHNNHINHIDLIGHNNLADFIGQNGLVSITGFCLFYWPFSSLALDGCDRPLKN